MHLYGIIRLQEGILQKGHFLHPFAVRIGLLCLRRADVLVPWCFRERTPCAVWRQRTPTRMMFRSAAIYSDVTVDMISIEIFVIINETTWNLINNDIFGFVSWTSKSKSSDLSTPTNINCRKTAYSDVTAISRLLGFHPAHRRETLTNVARHPRRRLERALEKSILASAIAKSASEVKSFRLCSLDHNL